MPKFTITCTEHVLSTYEIEAGNREAAMKQFNAAPLVSGNRSSSRRHKQHPS